MDKQITLIVDDEDILFNVGADDYNAFVNEMQPNNKVTPAHNFLVRTVNSDNKEQLLEKLKLPGAALQLVGSLVQEYLPDISVSVGKPSA